MGHALDRLIYASRWAPEIKSDIEETTRRIIAASIARNRLADVTGLLLAHDGWFVQALEGSPRAIGQAMGRIVRDPRHHEVRVLSAQPVQHRAFRDWNMVDAPVGEQARPILLELGMSTLFDGHRLDPSSAYRLTLALAEDRRLMERASLGLDLAVG